MKRKPTIDDFSTWIEHQLSLAEKEAQAGVQKVEREAAAAGAFQSGRTVIYTNKAIEEQLNRGIQIALSELKSAVENTDIGEDFLQAKTVAALQEFLRRLSNLAGDVGRRVGPSVAGPVAEQLEKWKKHLEFMIQQFEVGFFKPTLPIGVISMTDNSIKIGGSVTGSAIQQGSPGAKQVVAANAQTFEDMNAAIQRGISDAEERMKILAVLQELKVAAEKYQSETGGTWYGLKYKEFIEAAANHMNLVAPFIPSLTKWL